MIPERNVAIVLHGPPAVGKTAISGSLRSRVGENRSRHISLDDGWHIGQFRYQGGVNRYSDLASAVEPVLIIELGCGEPPDLAFPGATRGADEWIDALRKAGREIFCFLLSADSQDVEKRLEDRCRGNEHALFLFWQYFGLLALYDRQHALVTIPGISGISESRIETSGRTVLEVAESIISACMVNPS